MKIEALYNAIIVKPVDIEETRYGNIVVPDLGNDTNKTAEVVGVGPGHTIFAIGHQHVSYTDPPGDTETISKPKHSASRWERW